jgi:RNA 2',3'-cyclic 3'-phosphodiesterase
VIGATGGRPTRPKSSRRLFFALWPADDARHRLTRALRDLVAGGAGRPQRPDQWHVTLEFLGDVPESRLRAVLDAGAAAADGASPCEVEFDRLEHWKRPAVLCLAAGSVPEPLVALVQALRSELQLRGFTPETRAFRPHLTLMRGVAQAPPPAVVEPQRWVVRKVSLVESVTDREGARYVELAAWPTGT